MGTTGGEFVDELIEVLGADRAIDLAEAFGGTRLYVASSVKANCKIVKAMGEDVAVALMERFAPTVISVPILRQQRVIRYSEQGLSIAQIATRLLITERGVQRVLRQHRERKTP
ncbi:MAG: hypothetical protein ACK4TC_12530 [Sphingomonas pseudosanguinis]|uniref:hypothetical protein n=1 Tax=Sphingomonas pseudosanguinis TaxID=413712 RepID=UPI00391B65A3